MTSAHDPRCMSLQDPPSFYDDGTPMKSCDCFMFALIEAAPDLRERVGFVYPETHAQVAWWKQYAKASDDDKAAMRLLLAVDDSRVAR